MSSNLTASAKYDQIMRYSLPTFALTCLLTASHVHAQSRVAVTETVTECTSVTNGTGAVVGAGAGYVVGRMLFGKGAGSLLGGCHWWSGWFSSEQAERLPQYATHRGIPDVYRS